MDPEKLPHGRAALLCALRPHQWAKNALIALPALAAHLAWTPALGLRLLLGLTAFSAASSALYLVNDLVDLPADRVHPTKRSRPIASGALGVRAAALAAVALAAVAAALAIQLPGEFRVTLAAYAALSAAYSFSLKRRPVLDVIVLATLYTARVVAGAALVDVPLSRWFLAFSILLFLSLALVKRVVELQAMPEGQTGFVRGRSYVRDDLPTLVSLGAACTAASALVYCLYVTGDDVGRLYRRPDLLWIGLPLILYWQARIWLITGRGDMHEDPVAFALRDRVGYFVIAAFLLTVLAAK
jgi:4-hydroxybenzoate polyprenyltransferase